MKESFLFLITLGAFDLSNFLTRGWKLNMATSF